MRLGPAQCAPRIGVARLAKLAFDGCDLRPLFDHLLAQLDGADAPGLGLDLSVIAQFMGDSATGLALQSKVLERQRLFRSPCRVATPRLRVLAIAAPSSVGANTPLEFLLQDSDVELTTLYVVPGLALPDPLPEHDIAIVTAPDDGVPGGALGVIEQLARAWPRPLLNAPSGLPLLNRDRLYKILAGAPGVEVPVTTRVSRAELGALGDVDARARLGAGFPLIARPIGSHAGRGLSKLAAADAVEGYLRDQSEEVFFVSPLIDYSSPDGLFRKYRLICIGEDWYAGHMAISDGWDIWYLNAGMSVNGVKRAEESHFMVTFDDEFGARHRSALREIQRRLGLDYFLVDCAETKAGDLLVFEADHTAIAHAMDPPDIYPYKRPQMEKVFNAFAALLYARAGIAQAQAA